MLSLKWFYEKSKVKQLFPLLLLIGYSFVGGALFHYLESEGETQHFEVKSAYLNQTKHDLLLVLKEQRQVKKVARYGTLESRRRLLPILKTSAYWFTLSLYYLTDMKKEREARQPNKLISALDQLKKYTNQLAERCWEISIEANGDDDVLKRKLFEALDRFQDFTILGLTARPVNFWNSMFLAMTTITTIGYGNVVPRTYNGRVLAIVYATFGIPLFLMILHKMGRIFLALLQRLCVVLSRLWVLVCGGVGRGGGTVVVETPRGREVFDVPVSLAVGVTFAWIFACAGIFNQIEGSWDYFTSFYFVFISLTTIGYGDVVPTKSEDMFFTFGLIIVGLSLVSMCINVVQIKLEHLFEDLMLMMMEEYQSAQGDMQGPPPDIQGSLGVKALWKMWHKRKSRERTSSTASSLHAPDTSANLLLPLLDKKRKDALLSEWNRKSTLKNKCTQTSDSFLQQLPIELATQTTPPSPSAANSTSNRTAYAYVNNVAQPGVGWNSRSESPFFAQAGSVAASWQTGALGLVSVPEGPEVALQASDVEGAQYAQLTARCGSIDSRNSVITTYCSSKNSALLTEAEVHSGSFDRLNSTPFASASAQRNPRRLYRGTLTSGGSPVISSVSWPQHSHTTHVVNEGAFASSPKSSRSWTFVPSGHQSAAGLGRRGSQPRGLVHAMAIKKQSKEVFRDDLKGLMREIDLRLDDCRGLSVPAAAEPDSACSSRRTSRF